MSIIWYSKRGQRMRYKLIKTLEYENWLEDETLKSRVQIANRLEKIETEGHFGVYKDIGDEIFERRVCLQNPNQRIFERFFRPIAALSHLIDSQDILEK